MTIDQTVIAAQNGNAEAQWTLGNWYYYGQNGFTQNYTRAAYWYEKSAYQGYGKAQYSIGFCYQKGQGVTKNELTALTWYREGAKRGSGPAMYSIGEYYEKGIIVNKDYYLASDWYRKASDADSIRAITRIGDILFYGQLNHEQELYKAASYYEAGAEFGDAYCMYSLGYCYQYGKGVPQNLSKAIDLYRQAARKGNVSAKNALQKLGY